MSHIQHSVALLEPEPVSRMMLGSMLEAERCQVTELDDFDMLEASIVPPTITIFSTQADPDAGARVALLKQRWPETVFWVLTSDSEALPEQWHADACLYRPIDQANVKQQLARLNQEEVEGMSAELNIELLEQYREIVGEKLIRENLALFEQTLPEYLAQLQESVTNYELEELAEHAHKLKGAAASVGLLGIQHIAEKLQHREREGWDQHYSTWVKWIQTGSDANIAALKQWLAQ